MQTNMYCRVALTLNTPAFTTHCSGLVFRIGRRVLEAPGLPFWIACGRVWHVTTWLEVRCVAASASMKAKVA